MISALALPLAAKSPLRIERTVLCTAIIGHSK
jgi:hypothetical protein